MSRSRLVLISILVSVAVFSVAAPAHAAVGDYLGQWGESGTGDGQFNRPYDVAFAPNGDVYVADRDNNRIQYFGPTGTYKGEWGESGTGNGQFGEPAAVSVAPNGDVYVADTSNHRIQYFSPTGTFKGKWGALGPDAGNLQSPADVTIAPDGTVYVADTQNNRIQYFSPTGALMGTWGSSGTGNGQFGLARAVELAPNGDVYVADQLNNRIQRFSPIGTYKGKWGSFGTGNGQFDYPGSIAIGRDGDLYVTDYWNQRVQRFGLNGLYRGTWGAPGDGDGQFAFPTGVAVASDGRVYVADSLNNRIQRFKGVTAAQHDAGGVTFSRFVSGYNAAYSGGGYVYSRWAGETLEVRFYGSKITWIGPKQPNYGKAEIFLDGSSTGNVVDCYVPAAAKTTEAVLYATTLPEGLHTLRIKVSATKNPASTGNIVVVDRFEIDGANPKAYAGRSDEKFGSFAGPWIYGANSAYIAKGYHYSRYPNAVYTAAFYGTGVAWIGPKTGAYGRAKVYIDGVQQGTVVSQFGTMGWRERVWESPALARGVHTIKIVPTGTKDAASKSTNIVIDAIDVRP